MLHPKLAYLDRIHVAGLLLDMYDGAEGGLQAYRPTMFYAGSVSFVTTFLVLVVRIRMNRRQWVKLYTLRISVSEPIPCHLRKIQGKEGGK
jgi:hypothetical protein